MELQWKDYVTQLKKSGTLSNALAIADVSGSMFGEPMQVCSLHIRMLSAARPYMLSVTKKLAVSCLAAHAHLQLQGCQSYYMPDVARHMGSMMILEGTGGTRQHFQRRLCLLVQVSIALSLLVAQVAGPPFHNTILTFSETPKLHTVQGATLVDQVLLKSLLQLSHVPELVLFSDTATE